MNVPATVTVQLEGGLQVLPAGSTLADLVALLGHAPQAVATAVDGCFVSREQRAAQPLRDQQTVLLFQPIVGG